MFFFFANFSVLTHFYESVIINILAFQVVVAKETVGSLGGLIRQLSLDQFENESRRVHPTNGEQSYSAKKFLNRQKSPQGLHKKASM